MAIDNKYGRVTLEHTPDSMEDDELVVVFRSTDKLLIDTLNSYWVHCRNAKLPNEFVNDVSELTDKVRKWQKDHPDLVKLPD